MKKEYVKPYIVVESFQLNAAIAAGCNGSGKFALGYTQDTCTDLEEGGPGYFGAACAEIGLENVVDPGGDLNDGFCYHAALADIFLES